MKDTLCNTRFIGVGTDAEFICEKPQGHNGGHIGSEYRAPKRTEATEDVTPDVIRAVARSPYVANYYPDIARGLEDIATEIDARVPA